MTKKGQLKIILEIGAILVAFFLILIVINTIVGGIGKRADEQTCRNSVLLREKSNQLLQKTTTGGIATKTGLLEGTPLLCGTKDKVLSGDPESIKQQIADLAASCWYEFGQGTVADPLKEGNYGGKQECFVCYTFALKSNTVDIPGNQFLQYMQDTTYFLDKTATPNVPVTYLQYIQNYGAGSGSFLATSVTSPEVYAISYGVKSSTCDSCTKTSAVIGGVAGVATLAFCLEPLGWVACGATALAVGGGTFITTALTGAPVVKTVADWKAYFDRDKRLLPTIYITPLNAAKEYCNVQSN